MCVLSLVLVGCTTYKAPKLTVVDVLISEASDDAMVLMFLIDVENPNDVEIPLQEASYILSLDGHRVFSGNRSPQTTLHRLGTQRIELPAVIPIPEDGPAPTGSHSYTLGGTLVYITPGEIAELLFDSKLRRPTVRFSDRGTINFDEPVDPAPVAPADEEPDDDEPDDVQTVP